MSGLGQDARGIVAQARTVDGPSAEDRARIRAKLEPSWAAFRARQAGNSSSRAAIAVSRRGTPWGAFALWMSLTLWSPQLEATRSATLRDAAAGQPTAGADSSAARAAQLMASGEAAERKRSAAASTAQGALASASRDGSARRARFAAPLARDAEGSVPARDEPHRHERNAPPANAAPRTATDTDAHGPIAARSAAAPTATAASLSRSGRAARSAAASSGTAANLSQRAPPPSAAQPADAPASSPHEASLALTPLARGGAAAEAGDATPSQRNPGFVPQPLDDELEWIGAAQDALRKHQPTTVLRLVQEHAFRYPQGALAPERLALHALALCALQRRAAARTVLADLARRTPSSPLLDRVQRNCGL